MRRRVRGLRPGASAGSSGPFKRRSRVPVFWFLLLFIFIQPSAFPQSQPYPEDTLLFREGEALLSKGETEKALWRFKKLLSDYPKSPLFHESKFRMGVCYTRLKMPRDAVRVLTELLPTFLAPDRMFRVLTLLGDNHLELKDRPGALYWYGKGLLVAGQPLEELKRKVRSVIDKIDREEELSRIESQFRGAYGGGYAKLKLAGKARDRGDDLLAGRMLAEIEKEYPKMGYPLQSKPFRQSEVPPASNYVLGVILPLSGIHQPFGERVLQGIQLSLQELESRKEKSFISLAIRDSKGNPGEAEKAVEELAAKEKVIAILGPLLSATAEGAARKAHQLQVPLLTFSQKEPLPGSGEFVFQNSLSPSAQVRAVADYAFLELKLHTVGIFYPHSPYGAYYRDLFKEEAVRRGGKISGVIGYQESQTDFGQEIKTFFRIPAPAKEHGRRREEEFKPRFSIDGLFIPDTHDRVGLILSQLAYYEVRGITCLGINGWNGPGLLGIAGKAAEGSVFVDAFLKEDPFPPVSRFVSEFRTAYGREPEILEAMGYDGAKFLINILQSKMISSPLQLREEFHRVQNFQGVAGLKGFGRNGKPIRTFSIFRVNHGKIERVSRL